MALVDATIASNDLLKAHAAETGAGVDGGSAAGHPASIGRGPRGGDHSRGRARVPEGRWAG
jgi:hypothetical protein